jgi:hypothetical protein
MAEAFGIVAGALSIAGLFKTCVDCFEYVHIGRNFGRDYQTSQIKLDIANVRLTRWGKAVNIYEDPKLGDPNASDDHIQATKHTLAQILTLFAATEKMSKGFKLGAKPSDLAVCDPSTDMEPMLLSLHNKMRDLAIRRQKGTSSKEKIVWALYKSKQFERLVEDITELVEGLENLFPAEESRRRLVTLEVEEIQDESSLVVLKEVANGVDTLLQEAANTAVVNLAGGHSYRNMTAMDDARVRHGDEYADNALVQGFKGSSHSYDGVTARGNARVHSGNKYGGKSILDD